MLSSCSHSPKRMAASLQSSATKIETIENKKVFNTEAKLKEISSLSYGVQKSLNTSNVFTASVFNDRILTLSGNPTLDQTKKMDIIIKELSLSNDINTASLQQKDKDIIKLQIESDTLKLNMDKELDKYKVISEGIASKNLTLNDELNKMNRWFGLGAVAYGLKKFILTNIIILAIFSILYISLSVFSSVHPIIALLFKGVIF